MNPTDLLVGKVVGQVETMREGHYNYEVVLLTFTDGTRVKFRATANADVITEIMPNTTVINVKPRKAENDG